MPGLRAPPALRQAPLCGAQLDTWAPTLLLLLVGKKRDLYETWDMG